MPATDPVGATVIFSVTATDAVDGTVVVSCTPASGTGFAIGVTIVACTASDTAGNTAHGSFTVTVTDTTSPVVTVPADISVGASDPIGAVVTFAASALDNVDGSLLATCVPLSGSVFALGTTTVTCSSTDAAGNNGAAAFTITVTDLDGPALALPADLVAEATSADGATVTFTASASDQVDGSVPVTCVADSGSTFALGTSTVNCSASDLSGNTTQGSFTVTVRDTNAPVISVPADFTVQASGPSGASVSFTVSASDAVGGTSTPTCSPAAGSTFPVGSTVVQCHATDTAGNSSSASFTITVGGQADQPPVLHLPADITTPSTDGNEAIVTYAATATDIGGSVAVTCTPPSGSTFVEGVTTVGCEATGATGLTTHGTFTVTVTVGTWLAPGCYGAGPGSDAKYLGPENTAGNIRVHIGSSGGSCAGPFQLYTLVRADPNTPGQADVLCQSIVGTDSLFQANSYWPGLPADAWLSAEAPPDPHAPRVTSFGAYSRLPVSAPRPAPVTTEFFVNVMDPDGDPLTCAIDADGDGIYELAVYCGPIGPANSGVTAPVSYTTPGTHVASLRVSDGVSPPVIAAWPVVVAAPTETFHITLDIDPAIDSEIAAGLQAAATRWEQVIGTGAPDTTASYEPAENSWCPLAYSGPVDDLRIRVVLAPGDGPGNYLARGGYKDYRHPPTEYGNPVVFGDDLPSYGCIELDEADVQLIKDTNRSTEIFTHEMGHILGIGTSNFWFNAFQGSTGDQRLAVPGPIGVWNNMLGQTGLPPIGNIEPTEPGQHWSESVFGYEIMTPSLNIAQPGARPLAITVSFLADFGWPADLAAADSYSLPLPAVRRSPPHPNRPTKRTDRGSRAQAEPPDGVIRPSRLLTTNHVRRSSWPPPDLTCTVATCGWGEQRSSR